MNPFVSELSLYDIAGTEGVAADISHINTKAIAKVLLIICREAHDNTKSIREELRACCLMECLGAGICW